MIWFFKKLYYRIFQKVMKLASYFLDWHEPTLLTGAGSIRRLPAEIKKQNIFSVLIVTDKVIEGLGLFNPLLEGLDESGIAYTVYNGVQPNPSVENIEEARQLYLDNGCGAFIAFGGGSPMDCAKVAAARITNNKPVKRCAAFSESSTNCPRCLPSPPQREPARNPPSRPWLKT